MLLPVTSEVKHAGAGLGGGGRHSTDTQTERVRGSKGASACAHGCSLTEKEGFEPSMQGLTPHNALAGRRLQPLGHFSS